MLELRFRPATASPPSEIATSPAISSAKIRFICTPSSLREGYVRGERPDLGSLEPPDHREPELGGALAVDDPVVERHGEVAHAPDGDLAVAHHRAVGDAVDAQD